MSHSLQPFQKKGCVFSSACCLLPPCLPASPRQRQQPAANPAAPSVAAPQLRRTPPAVLRRRCCPSGSAMLLGELMLGIDAPHQHAAAAAAASAAAARCLPDSSGDEGEEGRQRAAGAWLGSFLDEIGEAAELMPGLPADGLGEAGWAEAALDDGKLPAAQPDGRRGAHAAGAGAPGGRGLQDRQHQHEQQQAAPQLQQHLTRAHASPPFSPAGHRASQLEFQALGQQAPLLPARATAAHGSSPAVLSALGSTLQPPHAQSAASRQQAHQQALRGPADAAACAAAAPHSPPATPSAPASPGYSWQDDERLRELPPTAAVHTSAVAPWTARVCGVCRTRLCTCCTVCPTCNFYNMAACVCCYAC